jgi:hypothetical protein
MSLSLLLLCFPRAVDALLASDGGGLADRFPPFLASLYTFDADPPFPVPVDTQVDLPALIVAMMHIHRWSPEECVAIALALAQRLCVAVVLSAHGEREVPLTSLHRRTSSRVTDTVGSARVAHGGVSQPPAGLLRLVGLQGDATATTSTTLLPTVDKVAESVEITLLATLPMLKQYVPFIDVLCAHRTPCLPAAVRSCVHCCDNRYDSCVACAALHPATCTAC